MYIHSDIDNRLKPDLLFTTKTCMSYSDVKRCYYGVDGDTGGGGGIEAFESTKLIGIAKEVVLATLLPSTSTSIPEEEITIVHNSDDRSSCSSSSSGSRSVRGSGIAGSSPSTADFFEFPIPLVPPSQAAVRLYCKQHQVTSDGNG